MVDPYGVFPGGSKSRKVHQSTREKTLMKSRIEEGDGLGRKKRREGVTPMPLVKDYLSDVCLETESQSKSPSGWVL